jgi:putative membrane protein
MKMTGQAISPACVSGAAADNFNARSWAAYVKNMTRYSAQYPLILLGVFLLWWSVLAIKPWYRQDWLLENALVFIVVPTLVWGYQRIRLSNFSYTMIFIFLCLHEIGAHYTYAEVPYRTWLLKLTGSDINALLDIDRNHYDRLVHFMYGFLLLPAYVEIFNVRAKLKKIWRFVVPVAFIMSQSELFELIEWQAAEIFGGPLGQAYLGTQGDVWDAQKDSFAAAAGAMLSMAIYHAYEYFRKNNKRFRDLLLMD